MYIHYHHFHYFTTTMMVANSSMVQSEAEYFFLALLSSLSARSAAAVLSVCEWMNFFLCLLLSVFLCDEVSCDFCYTAKSIFFPCAGTLRAAHMAKINDSSMIIIAFIVIIIIGRVALCGGSGRV